MAFEELYQEIILDHYRRPHHYGKLENVSSSAEHENPVCGDQIRLMVQLTDSGLLEKIGFEGHGCAISMASTSIMTDEVSGKSVEQIKAMVTKVLQAMRGEIPAEALDELGDLGALKGVIRFPVRVKCATLAWHALKDALKL